MCYVTPVGCDHPWLMYHSDGYRGTNFPYKAVVETELGTYEIQGKKKNNRTSYDMFFRESKLVSYHHFTPREDKNILIDRSTLWVSYF